MCVGGVVDVVVTTVMFLAVKAKCMRTRSGASSDTSRLPGICLVGRVAPRGLIGVCRTLNHGTRKGITMGLSANRPNKRGFLRPALVTPLMQGVGNAVIRYGATCNNKHTGARTRLGTTTSRNFATVTGISVVSTSNRISLPMGNNGRLGRSFINGGCLGCSFAIILSRFGNRTVNNFNNTVGGVSVNVTSSNNGT